MPRLPLRQAVKDALHLRLLPIEIAVALLFFVVALGAMVMTRVNGGIALVWPADVIAAAFLIRSPKVRWFGAATALFVAGVASNVIVAHRAWPISIELSCVNGAEIGMMAWIFRSLVRFPYPNINIEQAAIMTAVLGVVIPGLSSIGGSIVLYINYGLSLTDGALQWWSSHAIGACLVGPPVILGSAKAFRRLLSAKFLAQNLAIFVVVLIGCWLAVRYVRFPFVVIGTLLLIAAFRVGGFGASILGLASGFTIAALWAFGVRPEGLENTPIVVSLSELPVIALLATTMPPIAVGLGTDARRAAVRKLHVSEHRFRESMEHSPIGMLIANLDGVWGYTNRALQTMLGYSAEEFRALPPGGPSDPGEWTSSPIRWQRLVSGEIESYEVERRFRHKNERWVWTRVAVSLLRDEDGSPLHLIAQIESLEARHQAEAKLAEERERLKITLSSIADAVITADAETRITYINAAAEALLGLALVDIRDRRLDEVIFLTDPRTSKAAANLVDQARVHGKAFRRDTPCVLHRPDGIAGYVRDVVSPLLDSQGSVTGIVVVLHDASADVKRAQDLDHRASHDPLTGLANRFEFQCRLKDVFDRAIQLQVPAAVVAIDLDRFKAVNDTGGHAVGDVVLRRVAEVLRESVRQSDVVARVGGDEFVILLPNCPAARSHLVGHQILQALNPLHVTWEACTYAVGASVGVAMIAPIFKEPADWLAAADRACYQAKHEGRGLLRSA